MDDDKIPYKYFEEYPTFFETKPDVYVLDTETYKTEIKIGDIFEENEFHNDILKNIRKASERMHDCIEECRKAEKNLKASFNGRETFII